jgi:hypothetical protein
MGVTMTHPLPPLKRGGLSGEAQFVKIPAGISKSFKNFPTGQKNVRIPTQRGSPMPSPLERG